MLFEKSVWEVWIFFKYFWDVVETFHRVRRVSHHLVPCSLSYSPHVLTGFVSESPHFVGSCCCIKALKLWIFNSRFFKMTKTHVELMPAIKLNSLTSGVVKLLKHQLSHVCIEIWQEGVGLYVRKPAALNSMVRVRMVSPVHMELKCDIWLIDGWSKGNATGESGHVIDIS